MPDANPVQPSTTLPLSEEQICFHADRKGRIINYSSLLYNFIGGTPIIYGASLLSFISPDEYLSASQLYENALKGIPGYDYFRFKTNNGSRIGLVTLVPSWNNGKPDGIYGFIKDATDRVDKTQKLYESEQKFDALFNSEQQYVIIVSPSGQLIDINKSGLKMLERKRKEDVLNQAIYPMVHADDRPVFIQMHEAACKGKSGSLRYRITGALNSMRWIESSSVPLKNNSGEIYAVLSIMKDVTNKKREEEALFLSQQQASRYAAQLTGILDTIGDGFLAVDPSWTVTFWNKKAEELMGRSTAEMQGKNLWEQFPSAIPPTFYEELLRSMEDRVAVHFEENYNEVWYDVSAYPSANGLSVYFKNISERRRKDQELKISNERYQFLDEATSDIIWDWNLDTKELYVNQSFTRILGHDISESTVLMQVWAKFLHPEDKERVVQDQAMAIRDPSVFYWEDTYRFAREDGSLAMIKDRAVIIRNDEGRALRMIGSAQDITKQHEAESKLRKNERLFRAMVQSGMDVVVLLNKNFVIQYISPNAFFQSGYTSEELTGVRGFDRIHPDDLPMLFREGLKVIDQKAVLLPHFRFRIQSDEYLWLEASITNLLSDPDIESMVVNLRDITQRKKTEDEAKMLSLVAEKTVNSVIMTNAFHQVSWVNRAFSIITGYSYDEALGRPISEFLFPADGNLQTRAYLHRCLENQQPFNCEVQISTKHQHMQWIDIKGQPVFDENGALQQYFVIQTDISSRKEIEEAIRLSEEKYKLLFYQSPIPKWIYRYDNLRFIEVNEAAIQNYGYSREEFLSMTILDIRTKREREKFKKHYQLKERKKGDRFEGIMKHLKKNGAEIRVEITTHALDLPTGLHVIAEASDITEKMQLEQLVIEEKISAQKEIAKAIINTQEKERSEIGKELHDNVNQLLTTTKLYVENTRYYPEQSVLYIDKSTELLQRAINEIRSLSKALVTPTMYDIGFQATLEELIEHYRALNIFNIGFEFHANEAHIEKGMKLTIYRILQELLNNCLKYAGATQVLVQVSQEEGPLRILVQDNGRGFDLATRKKGLGLSNIKNRAEVFKGVVRIQSAPGQGCMATILFPNEVLVTR